MIESIKWLGHDAFCIVGDGVALYTDPYMFEDLSEIPPADIILITHSHHDHLSPDDIAKIQTPETVIVATPDCKDNLTGDVRFIKPGDTLEIKGMSIEAVPAYNTNKNFHPKENNWVGYIFTMEGSRIYHAGDTDHITEMKDIKCDIALLPVSGTYVMTADEAVSAALDINPDIVIPMHYGSPVIGTIEDAKRFASALKGKVKVEILEQLQ